MRILDGLQLAGFIKERQAYQVRALRQAHKIFPKLAIVRTNPDPVVDSYMRLKQKYGTDILIDVDVHTIKQSEAKELIKKLNADETVHGIIVQIPLPDPSETDGILNLVAPEKDVDGLGANPKFDPATPVAVNWLLVGYNVELKGKKIVIVGQGRLVGRPLAKMWQDAGLDVRVADRKTEDLSSLVRSADIVVSATGVPALITPKILKIDAVVVDAGVATDKNGLVGDVAPEARERNDLTITPEKGGVGPLTVCALFDNVIRAALARAKTKV
ncbi:MAG: tetrahydrofolate dehydrogenase/cyclohydrolase catalytic domain-containing protein [Candidatus Saccharimonadales bacterium]